jgi:hypothetical protein
VRIYETCTYTIYLPSSPTTSCMWTNLAAIKERVIGEQDGPLWVRPPFKSPCSNGASDIISCLRTHRTASYCHASSRAPPTVPCSRTSSNSSFLIAANGRRSTRCWSWTMHLSTAANGFSRCVTLQGSSCFTYPRVHPTRIPTKVFGAFLERCVDMVREDKKSARGYFRHAGWAIEKWENRPVPANRPATRSMTRAAATQI